VTPFEHLRVVHELKYPTVLLSAYDLSRAATAIRRQLVELLTQYCGDGGVVMFDSGAYESYWLRDQSWMHSEYVHAVQTTPLHLAFCLDAPREVSAEAIIRATNRDRDATKSSTIAPIVHSNTASEFPALCSRVARALHSPLLAVPERELGADVVQGAGTLKEIRIALDQLGFPISIHVLGAGNPLSLLVYAASGAASFDGLDWCQTVADYATATMHHSRLLPVFENETEFSGRQEIGYGARLLAHNLQFYRGWMNTLQGAAASGDFGPLLAKYLPNHFLKRLPSQK